MKKISLARRNALLSSTSISWGIFALVFAILALIARLVAPDFFLRATVPAFRAADAISAKSHAFFNSFGDSITLSSLNEQLARENAALINENSALREKTVALEKIIGTSGRRDSTSILAGVLARPPTSPYDTLVLSLGSSAGVKLGMEAFSDGGVPVGIVSVVTENFSRVTLFSAPKMITRGWVGSAEVPIDIFGEGAGAMNASVARFAGIVVGDKVFVPGPGMLPIGSVARIDGNPSSPSVALRIAPAINPFAITWVTLRDVGADSYSLLSSTSTP